MNNVEQLEKSIEKSQQAYYQQGGADALTEVVDFMIEKVECKHFDTRTCLEIANKIKSMIEG